MDAAAYNAMPRMAGHCAKCHRPHPKGASNNRKWCEDCRLIVQAVQKAEWAVAHDLRRTFERSGRPVFRNADQPYLTTRCAQQRQIADKALDKGGTKRYCSEGHLYRLAAFDTPCPFCGDRLVPEPVTFQPGD